MSATFGGAQVKADLSKLFL